MELNFLNLGKLKNVQLSHQKGIKDPQSLDDISRNISKIRCQAMERRINATPTLISLSPILGTFLYTKPPVIVNAIPPPNSMEV